MYQSNRLTALLILAVMIGAAYAAEITDVMVRQRWPWSRKVDIEYILDCELSESFDIEIKAYNGSTLLELPVESLSGDMYSVSDGTHRIVWDPTQTPYADSGSFTKFKVDLFLKTVPLYMIVDLNEELGDSERIEYVYESDLTNDIGDWGTWERNPVTNDTSVIESVIWTGVTNDNVYRTDKVVLRRIKAGSFVMGETTGTKTVILTRDFYIGVFPITQEQWKKVQGTGRNSYFIDPETRAYRPMEQIAYDFVRGTNLGTNWPGVDGKGDYRVDDDSFMGVMRARTGGLIFDLPTDAQWEYACRAGTTTYYNDGKVGAPNEGVGNNTTSNTFLDVLGRYRYNGGYINGGEKDADRDAGPTNATAIVGSYRPNAWGLYDMHGNIHEWAMDWAATTITGGTDPAGPMTGTNRVRRGGAWGGVALDCRSAVRSTGVLPSSTARHGFRLALALP